MTQHHFSHRSIRTSLSVMTIIGCLMAMTTSSVFAASPSPSPRASATPKASASPKVTPSPKATPSPSPSPADTTTKLKERIDKVLEQRKEQVKGVIDQLSSQRRGIVGEIQRVTDKNITLKNSKGTEIITVPTGLSLIRDGKKATLDDVAVGEWAVAMGYGTPDDFRLKRLVISSTTLRPKKMLTIIGTLKSVTATQMVLTPRTATDEKSSQLTLSLPKSVSYQDNEGNATDRKALEVDNQYLVVGYEDDSKQIVQIVRALAPTKAAASAKPQ